MDAGLRGLQDPVFMGHLKFEVSERKLPRLLKTGNNRVSLCLRRETLGELEGTGVIYACILLNIGGVGMMRSRGDNLPQH